MSDDEKLKVIEGKFGTKEEKPSGSDMLQAAADFLSEMEDETGVEAEVVTIVQLKGVPTIQYSNVDMNRMTTLLDFAKWDCLTAMVNADYAEVHGEDDDDDTIH